MKIVHLKNQALNKTNSRQINEIEETEQNFDASPANDPGRVISIASRTSNFVEIEMVWKFHEKNAAEYSCTESSDSLYRRNAHFIRLQ